MNELHYLSALEMAQAIRRKKHSSLQMVETCISRIEAVDSTLNAVVYDRFEQAREEAKLADRRAAKKDWAGPLHGVPITIKDSIEVKDLPCACGTEGRKEYIPSLDAVLVRRLRDAGAIVIAKTNVPELCLAYESNNAVFGHTNNPYDPSRSSGGSSGGEAALIAAGGSPLGLGSDAGGSIRFPAHACGIAGIKPNSGRFPRSGHFIPPGGAIDQLWQIGPMARRVDDLSLALPLMIGSDPGDPSVALMPLEDPGKASLKGLRIAWYADNGVMTPSSEIKYAVERSAAALEDAGAIVIEDRPACFGPESEIWLNLLAADGGDLIEQVLQQCGTNNRSPLIENLLRLCRERKMNTNQFHQLLFQWYAYRTEMASFMRLYDLILSPVCARTAIKHGTCYDEDVYPAFSYTVAHNLTGYPATTVRVGEDKKGLPIGVQFAAKAWREDVALAAAKWAEEKFGGWQAPDDSALVSRS